MSYLKDNLEVVLITYNRKNALEKTFESCFGTNSPIQEIDFTIIDNCSTDGTQELCESYAKLFLNIKYIRNRINIGGNANMCRAMEYAQKKYVWFLCDDDSYDWSNWEEIENALKEDLYDAVLVRRIKNSEQGNYDTFFSNSSFVPAVIYKSENITSTVMLNAYDNIKNMFPHLALSAKIINENKKIFVPKKSIIIPGRDPGITTYQRGVESKYLPESKFYMIWGVGFLNSTELILDKEIRHKVIDNACHHIAAIFDSLFSFFVHSLFLNYLNCDDYNFNKYQMKRLLSFRQKLIFLAVEMFVRFRTLFVDKSLYDSNICNTNWSKYFKKVGEQRYINSLARKYKNKRVLVYGAGMIFNVLKDEYDLSKLNITAICDGKFTTETKDYKGYKAITVPEINNSDYDVILFTLYRDNEIRQSLQDRGVNIDSESMIKHTLKVLWKM